jgi:hypothetical protein
VLPAVEAPADLDRGRHGLGGGVVVTDVGVHEQEAAVGGPERVELGRLADVGPDDDGPLGQEAERGGPTDARRRAGHEDGLVLEPIAVPLHVVTPLPSR